MKNGGGIFLIGLGTALLSLAYTGRAQAVWAALTEGGGDTTEPEPTEDTAQTIEDAPSQQAGAMSRTPLDGVPLYHVQRGGLRRG